MGYGGNSGGGIVGWLTRRLRQTIQKVLNKVTGTRGNVDKSKVKVNDEVKPEYIKEVDSFAKEEPVTINKVYNYGSTPEEVNLIEDDGEVVDGESDTPRVPEEEKDLWSGEEVTEADKEYYAKRLESMGRETPSHRRDIIRHYTETHQYANTGKVSEIRSIQQQIYENIDFDRIEHVPYFLTHGAEIEDFMKKNITSSLPLEEKDRYVMEELKRYRDVSKDFMKITEKDGKYFVSDWELGVRVMDFMIKDCRFPQIPILLTDYGIDEVVKIMRTGYLPEYLRGTPFEKVLKIFEGLAQDMVKSEGTGKYTFPRAYASYKQQLPMYKKLRNNGNLANVNTVLEYFYKTLDTIEVNADVQGDAYLGLIEPEKFINAYIQFFYGKAKQTQAMSEVTLKIMKKDPTILQEALENGYALGDKPEGTMFIVSGHLVLLVNVSKETYNLVVDKAPSDITSEDINTITGMFSAERKKAKLEKPKPKVKPVPKKKPKGMSYDYDEAIDKFKKDKLKKKTNKGG